MIHFGGNQGVHNLVWGQRTYEMQDPEAEVFQSVALRSRPMTGQVLGGLGIFRTAFGHPQQSFLSGAYLFDNYVTTYMYASGQYSLAIKTYLALTETLNLHDSTASNIAMQIALVENLTLHDAVLPIRISFVAVTEHLTLHDAFASNSIIHTSLLESLQLADYLGTNVPQLSYVVNLDTFSTVKYSNFNFNSYSCLNGKYYGVADDGLYLLDGDSDNGTNIDATFTLGKKDFDSDMLKRIPDIYLGVHSTGDLVLKVVLDAGLPRYYRVVAQASGDLRTNKVQTGKGLRSRYWQVGLSNINGSDFTLTSITFRAVELTRRIGGA